MKKYTNISNKRFGLNDTWRPPYHARHCLWQAGVPGVKQNLAVVKAHKNGRACSHTARKQQARPLETFTRTEWKAEILHLILTWGVLWWCHPGALSSSWAGSTVVQLSFRDSRSCLKTDTVFFGQGPGLLVLLETVFQVSYLADVTMDNVSGQGDANKTRMLVFRKGAVAIFWDREQRTVALGHQEPSGHLVIGA